MNRCARTSDFWSLYKLLPSRPSRSRDMTSAAPRAHRPLSGRFPSQAVRGSCVDSRDSAEHEATRIWPHVGSQHPSQYVKTLRNFELRIWPKNITSRDAESTCFKGSRTSCDVQTFWHFLAKFWPEKITSRDGCVLTIMGDICQHLPVDAAFLLTVQSFLLTVEHVNLQSTILAFLLTVGVFAYSFSFFAYN